jgi:hypothetical protein
MIVCDGETKVVGCLMVVYDGIVLRVISKLYSYSYVSALTSNGGRTYLSCGCYYLWRHRTARVRSHRANNYIASSISDQRV